VPASFAVDLAQLYATTCAKGPWDSLTLGYIGATYVHVGREAFLEGALERQASHILWLDTDMSFPPETAIRLAAHDRPVVACNCVMKHPQQIFTALRDGQRVPTREDSTGLETVDAIGLAVMLMRTEVLADLPRPWFQHAWDPATGENIGEDIWFCRTLRDAGYAIEIDHDLSKEIGHVGYHTYRPIIREAVSA